MFTNLSFLLDLHTHKTVFTGVLADVYLLIRRLTCLLWIPCTMVCWFSLCRRYHTDPYHRGIPRGSNAPVPYFRCISELYLLWDIQCVYTPQIWYDLHRIWWTAWNILCMAPRGNSLWNSADGLFYHTGIELFPKAHQDRMPVSHIPVLSQYHRAALYTRHSGRLQYNSRAFHH